jgi:hypothetical protein
MAHVDFGCYLADSHDGELRTPIDKTEVIDRQAQWASESFWREYCPSMHILGAEFLQGQPLFAVDAPTGQHLKDLVGTEGYFQLTPSEWNLPIAEMAALAARLEKNGIPAPFAFVFDEFWLLGVKVKLLVEAVLGPEFLRLPDFWAWHIDPQRGDTGWRPHRDKGHYSLREDGSTKALTVWIALSDSTTLNGCMYIVPANRDPTYGTPQDKEWKFEYSDIRALPAPAGTIFAWNQAVMHWGSNTSPRETQPRISVAFEFQATDIEPFNQPLMNPLGVPDFPMRLKLIAKQILQYQHMYPLSDEVRGIAEGIVAA